MGHVRATAAGLLLAAASSSFTTPGKVSAQQIETEALARIEHIVVNGRRNDNPTSAEVKVIRGTALIAATPSLSLFAADELITGVNVGMTIIMLDAAAEQDNTVHIGAASQFRLRGKRSIFLILGRVLADVRGLFDVVTSRATLGAKGTEFEVRVTESDTQLLVLEGAVAVTDEGGGRGGDDPVQVVRRMVPRSDRLAVSNASRFSGGMGWRLASTAPADQAPAVPHQRWVVEVKASTPVRAKQQLKVTNRCQQTHLYDVQGPDTLPWFNIFASERIEVVGGASRDVLVELQIDPSNVAASTYDGNAFIRCLDCFTEPGCAQNRDVLAVSIKLARSADLTVRSLEEITMGNAEVSAAPRKAPENRVRTAVNWSNDVILAGQPSYSARRVIPHFVSPDERARVFREARFAAVWRQEPGSFERLGEIYTDWGEGAKAVEAYSQESAVQPDRARSPEFLTDLAEANRLKGRTDDAERQVTTALKADPGNASALNTLGNVYLDRAEVAIDANDARTGEGLLESARSSYERSLDASPPQDRRQEAQAVARANVGETLVEQGHLSRQNKRLDVAQEQFARADREFKAAHSTAPQYAFSRVGWGDAFQGMGVVAQERGDPAAARAVFNRADVQYKTGLQAHPDLPEAHIGVGDLLVREGRQKEALGSYLRAATARPDEPAAYYRLGTLLEKQSPLLAARYLDTYLQLRPNTFKTGRTASRATEIVAAARRTPDTPVVKDPLPSGPVLVPDVTGMAADEAARTIAAAGFKVGRIEPKSSTRPPDTVIRQDPRARETARPGTTINLEVARREGRTVKVPNLIGDSRDHAIDDIKEERLQVGEIREQPGCEPGRVLAQNPQKDTRVPEGSVVSMTIAVAGPQAVQVPQVAGLPQSRAEAALRDRGLRIGRVNRTETDRQEPETVISQTPRPSAILSPGCGVDLEVAAPIPLVIVPRLVGLTEEQARQRLPRGVVGALSALRLGDITYRDYATVYGTARRGPAITVPTVIEQQPAADSRVRKGSAVDLVVVRPPGGEGTSQGVAVPRLQGLTLDEARNLLARANLGLGDVRYNATTRSVTNRIVSHAPAEGTVVRQGTRVSVVINGHAPDIIRPPEYEDAQPDPRRPGSSVRHSGK